MISNINGEIVDVVRVIVLSSKTITHAVTVYNLTLVVMQSPTALRENARMYVC